MPRSSHADADQVKVQPDHSGHLDHLHCQCGPVVILHQVPIQPINSIFDTQPENRVMEQPAPVAPPRRKVTEAEPKTPEEVKYDKFVSLHAEAYAATSHAMSLDEGGQKEPAFNAYQKALELIDKAVSLAHTAGFSAESVNVVDESVYKMRLTRKEILERVSDLQHSPSTADYLEGPINPAASAPPRQGEYVPPARVPPPYTPSPSIDEVGSAQGSSEVAVGVAGSGTLYENLNSNLNDLALEQEALRNPLPLNAQEIFSIGENVQIYFISTDDTVSAPTYPSFLRLVIINRDEGVPAGNQPPAFLQVGDWTYPLIPGQSPVLLAPDGSYVFPDLRAGSEGSSVGLILPTSLDVEQKKTLETILLQLIGLSQFPTPGKEDVKPAETVIVPVPRRFSAADVPTELPTSAGQRMSARVAAGLISGAEKIAHGLAYGAEKTSQYMDKGTTYLVARIDPATQTPVIPAEVKSGAKTARNITGKAVKLSGFLVNQLSRGTAKLGQTLAPYVHRTATQFYVKAMSTSETEASTKIDQVMEVTGGAIAGVGTVYLGLEHAAKVLAKSVANNTVQVVQHKYGQEAGAVANDTASTIGNTVLTGYNCKGFTPKNLVKGVAKGTGVAAVSSSTPPRTDGTKSPPPLT